MSESKDGKLYTYYERKLINTIERQSNHINELEEFIKKINRYSENDEFFDIKNILALAKEEIYRYHFINQ